MTEWVYAVAIMLATMAFGWWLQRREARWLGKLISEIHEDHKRTDRILKTLHEDHKKTNRIVETIALALQPKK